MIGLSAGCIDVPRNLKKITIPFLDAAVAMSFFTKLNRLTINTRNVTNIINKCYNYRCTKEERSHNMIHFLHLYGCK